MYYCLAQCVIYLLCMLMTCLAGQIKLCNASVLIVGAGGLGCPVAQYLAAAGVGMICINTQVSGIR